MLSWSESLAADAERWAEYLAENDVIKHDNKTMAARNQGESIGWFKPPKPKCLGPKTPKCVTCREIVSGWYKEVQNYNFSTGSWKIPGVPIKHFAQVRSTI